MHTSKFESLTAAAELDFPEYDRPGPEPIGLLRHWLAAAVRQGVREPRALALATADAKGRPSTRTIAITSVDDDGLVFTSHSSSQKGREIAVNPWASGLFYWRETGQQVVVSGPVIRLDDAVADQLWFARPVPLHAMSTVSRQSESLTDAGSLLAEAERLALLGTALARPERFAAYRLQPEVAEFWSVSRDRLHRRLRYDRDDRGWQISRLQP